MTRDLVPPKDDALMEAEHVLASIKKKADRYKFWSRLTALTMALLPLCIPISLLIFQHAIAVIIVSIITAILTSTGSLLALEKPYERWALYRKYHRLAHAEIKAYRYRFGKYTRQDSSPRRLIESVSALELLLHDEWAGLVPSSASVLTLARGAPTKDKEDLAPLNATDDSK